MREYKKRFYIFVIIWLLVLDYLILAEKPIMNYSSLNAILKPFASLIDIIAGLVKGNFLITLIIVNVVVALLFYKSYLNWEAKNKNLVKNKK